VEEWAGFMMAIRTSHVFPDAEENTSGKQYSSDFYGRQNSENFLICPQLSSILTFHQYFWRTAAPLDMAISSAAVSMGDT
jgi:hypothetical protein